MLFFLITFFLIYGSFHCYAFLIARAAFSFGNSTGIPLALFMLVMVVAPLLVRVSENYGLDGLACLMAWISFTWMGIIFFFVSTALVLDLYQGGLTVSGMVFRIDLSRLKISPFFVFIIPLVLTLAANAYGYFEARNIRTETIEFRSGKITEALRIVQVSDVHLGLIVRQKRLRLIVDAIKEAAPDILVCTGDLVDSDINDLGGIAALLQEVEPRFGKFAVTGNHEYYAGLDNSLKFLQKAGFIVLRGEVRSIEGLLNIAGVDDLTRMYMGATEKVSEKDLLASIDNGNFTLLLKHRPLVDREAIGLFDLQLSGHTHGGQIFPFGLLVKIFFPEQKACRDCEGCYLQVSNGAGTWGPPVRILAPPEITIVELVPASS